MSLPVLSPKEAHRLIGEGAALIDIVSPTSLPVSAFLAQQMRLCLV